MKVALYNVTTTTQMGGVESFVWEIATRLPSHGVQVDVIGGNGTIKRSLPAGCRVITFPYITRVRLARIPLVNRSATLCKFLERLSFGMAALPSLLFGKYHIIHIQKPYDLPLGVMVKFLTGAKLLFGCHGTDYIAGDRALAKFADGAVSCSHFNAAQIREHYRLSPIVVFNGFEPIIFHPQDADPTLRARFGGASGCLLLCAGRLVKWKGISYLLEALSSLDSTVKLLIAGEGEDRKRLEVQVKELGLDNRVTFLGRLDQEELARFYSISDLVILPSLAHETFSIVACEALACERAVVGTNVGGIPELVQELVPPGVSSALADKIRSLLSNPARRAEVARQGREQVFSYLTWSATTTRVFDVYNRILAGERVFE